MNVEGYSGHFCVVGKGAAQKKHIRSACFSCVDRFSAPEFDATFLFWETIE